MCRTLGLMAVLALVLSACDHEPVAHHPRGAPEAASASGSSSLSWVPEPLGTLGGERSEAFAVNDDGWVVGYAQDENGHSLAYRWSAETGMLGLGTLGGTCSTAGSINAGGTVVGYACDAQGNEHGFRVSGESMEQLPLLDGTEECNATGINDAINPEIVGVCYDGNGWRPVIWTDDGTTVSVQALPMPEGMPYGWVYQINSAGVAAGEAENGLPRPVMWSGGVATLLAAEEGVAWAYAVNEAGDIVGLSRFDGEQRATLWRAATGWTPENLGLLPNGYTSSRAQDVNDEAQIIGRSTNPSTPMLWTDGNMTALDMLPGHNSASPWGINDAGNAIVGTSSGSGIPSTAVIWRLTPTGDPDPEPEFCTYEGLRAAIDELEADGDLTTRQARTLRRLLDQAERFEARGQYRNAIRRLESFIEEIQAALGEDAEDFIECVEGMVTALEATLTTEN